MRRDKLDLLDMLTGSNSASGMPCKSYDLEAALRDLCWEGRDIDLGREVSRIKHPIDPLVFYREYVAASKPVVIEDAASEWPALQHWRDDFYLVNAMGDRKITVAMTPNGRADAVTPLSKGATEQCFALPHEEQMSMADFLEALGDKNSSQVLYAQAQNDSMRQEFKSLLEDTDPDLAWAVDIFGQPAEAVNLWIGDSRSVTTFHRDHFENMYAVVCGMKTFTLLPPCETYRLHKRPFQVAQYVKNGSDLRLELLQPPQLVSWCPIDIDVMESCDQRQQAEFPKLFDPELPPPLRVTVRPGEMLYLPCMWHHMVEQQDDSSGKVIACNYWFDMRFNASYAATMFIDKLSSSGDG